MQKTVVLLKPDALQRGLVGEIIHRFERKGLKLGALKMVDVSEAIIDAHYAQHKDKPFFGDLKKFMMSSPVVCMVWIGKDAVEVVRKMAGVTNGRQANSGTLRGDFSISQSNNIVHASDSAESAEEELKRFFEEGEIHDWNRVISSFVYSDDEI